MYSFNVSKKFDFDFVPTEKSASVMRMFGVTIDRLQEQQICHSCDFKAGAGQIVYITGPSGGGKSVLMREIAGCVSKDEAFDIEGVVLSDTKTVIDCIEGDFLGSLRALSIAGINDVFSVLNKPANLSEGQKWRFKMAVAIASGRKIIFADEFCTSLDRITAKVIAYNIRKFANRNKVTFILASCHDDILADLSPDVLVVKELMSETRVIYKDIKMGGQDLQERV